MPRIDSTARNRASDSGSQMKSAARVRVLIVDDHQMFADGLAAALDREPDIDVVGTASLVSESVEKASAVRPNVVVLDQLLPDGDGIEAAELIKHEVPGASVVMVTQLDDENIAARAVENGCSGFVTKDKSIDEVVAAIRAAAAGEAVIAPAMLARLFERPRQQDLGGRPDADLAVDRQAAARLGDDSVTGRESKTGSPAPLLGREERIEDPADM